MKTHLALTLVALLLTSCAEHDQADVMYGTLERHRIELTAESNQPVQEVLVREGTRVKRGTVLARLDRSMIDIKLRAAASEVTQARERLHEVARGSRQQEIIEARAALDSANAEFANRNREFERLQQLVTDRLVSASLLDAARAARDSAAGAREQAAARLSLRLEGSRTEAIAQANAALEAAIAREAEIKLSAERHTITAPVASVVEALPYRTGERPVAGATVVVLLAEEPAFARIYVPASRRNEVRPGGSASVLIDNAESLEGEVRFVSAEAAYTPYYALTQRERSRLSYLAEVDVSSRTDLPVGVPVQVRLTAVSPP